MANNSEFHVLLLINYCKILCLNKSLMFENSSYNVYSTAGICD